MEEQSSTTSMYATSNTLQSCSSNQGRRAPVFSDNSCVFSRFSEPWDQRIETVGEARANRARLEEKIRTAAATEDSLRSCPARSRCADISEISRSVPSSTGARSHLFPPGSAAVVDFLTSIGLQNASTIAIALRADAGVHTVEDLLVAVFLGVDKDVNSMFAEAGCTAGAGRGPSASTLRFRRFLASLDCFKGSHSGALHESATAGSQSCKQETSGVVASCSATTSETPPVVSSSNATQTTSAPLASSLPPSAFASVLGSLENPETSSEHGQDATHASAAGGCVAPAPPCCQVWHTGLLDEDTQDLSFVRSSDSEVGPSAPHPSGARKHVFPRHAGRPGETHTDSDIVIAAGVREDSLEVGRRREKDSGVWSGPGPVADSGGTDGGAACVEEVPREQSFLSCRTGKGEEDERACACCRCCLKVGDGSGECLCRYMRSPVLKAVAEKITEEECRVIVLQLVRYARERLTEVEFALLPVSLLLPASFVPT